MSKETRILELSQSDAQEFFSERYRETLKSFFSSETTIATLKMYIAILKVKLMDAVACFPQHQRTYVKEVAAEECLKIDYADVFKDFENDFMNLFYEDIKVFQKYLSEENLYSFIVRELSYGGTKAIANIVAQICEKTSAEYVESFKLRLEDELENCEDLECKFYKECTQFGPCLKNRTFKCNGKCRTACNCPLAEGCFPDLNVYPCRELNFTTNCNGIY